MYSPLQVSRTERNGSNKSLPRVQPHHINESAAMSSSPLVVGARVRLVGLRAREELNGVEAVLLKLDGDRWAVRCVLSSERVRVKPTNLQLTPDLHERLNGSNAQQSGSLDGSSGLEKLDSSIDDSCGLERLVLQPVSYTHLTLPTKRIV